MLCSFTFNQFNWKYNCTNGYIAYKSAFYDAGKAFQFLTGIENKNNDKYLIKMLGCVKSMKDILIFNDFKNMILKISDVINENILFLSELDSVIGDGDHGTSMARGFNNTVEIIIKNNPKSISEILDLVGSTMISTIGGVTGPVFGSLFSGMGEAYSKEKNEINLNELSNMFTKGYEKVMEVAPAKPGEKTMVDALLPALESLEDSVKKGKIAIKDALESMAKAAKVGAEFTKDMIATKGRARYAGERALGHEDAGANTIYLIIRSMSEAL